MDTVEYSEHLVRVGKNIMQIAENIESAADEEADGAERQEVIKIARAKLADYNNVVAKLAATSKVQEAAFVKRFEHDIGLIRESLERIDK